MLTVRGRHSKHRIIVGFLAVMGSILLVRLFLLTVVESRSLGRYADDVSSRAVYETATTRRYSGSKREKSWRQAKPFHSIKSQQG